MKKILFVVNNTINAGDGFATRVKMEIELLNNDFEVVLLGPSNYNPKNDSIKYISYKRHEGKLRYIRDFFSLKKVIKNIVSSDQKIIVCGESLRPSFLVALFLPAKTYFVFDCHGTEPNEIKMRIKGKKGKLLYWISYFQEKTVVKRANSIVTVTKKQFDLFREKKQNIVLPMLPSDYFLNNIVTKDSARKKLGIDTNKVVYCYSGGAQVWQKVPETIEYYKKIENENTLFLIITQEQDLFKSLVSERKVKNYIILSADYKDMPSILPAADYGFCVRENTIVNNVASPTKLLEYIACGIRPIITPGIGDLSEFIVNNDLGICIQEDNNWMKETVKTKQKKNGKTIVKELVADYSQKYLEFFHKI